MSDRSLEMHDISTMYPPDRAIQTAIAAGVVPKLLEEGLQAEQVHENDIAKVVITCEPEGASLMMGALHPRASLYERPVNLQDAKRAHKQFRDMLRKQGCKVLTVREILSFDVDTSITARIQLEKLAMKALTYKLADDQSVADLEEKYTEYISDDYKAQVLRNMSAEQLIDTIMIHPTVTIAPSYRDTGLSSTYSFQPLSNLVYTRDQQITTCRGIVLGRLRSSQRQLEVDLMEFCFKKLGLDVIGRVEGEGYLEGGDFFPAGDDLALLGVGLRSNYAAAKQLMEKNLLGTTRFAVVRDDHEQHQDRMHLDCVFSILSNDSCLMLDEMMGEDSKTRRLVDLWVKDKRSGKYTLEKEGVEFSKFMMSEGYAIMPVSGESQLKYGCNCLNVGANRIIAVHEETARQIANFEGFSGHVQYIDFSSITSMYGAVHCGSQVLVRQPLPESDKVENGRGKRRRE